MCSIFFTLIYNGTIVYFAQTNHKNNGTNAY